MNRRIVAGLLGIVLLVSLTSWVAQADDPPPYDPYTGGYTAIDSNAPGGPVYNFVDISGDAGATTLALADDDGIGVDLPFDFKFFGTDYSQATISSNGLISFTGDLPKDGGGEQYLPDSRSPNGLIAGYWSDMDPSQGGTIAYETRGSQPSRQFIVMYKDVPHFQTLPVRDTEVPRETFEIILFEGTTKAVVQYSHVAGDQSAIDPQTSGALYSAGIEDANGELGLSYGFAQAYYDQLDFDNLAVAYEQTGTPPPPPPPPGPPIVTNYAPPFVNGGADNLERDGHLPERSASAKSTGDATGAISLSSSAHSTVTTNDIFPAAGTAWGWTEVKHAFATTSTYAQLEVRVRLDDFKMKATGVGDQTYARLDATLHDAQGSCPSRSYYLYARPFDPRYDRCGREVGYVNSGFPLGENVSYITTPKEMTFYFDLYPSAGEQDFFFNLTGEAYADSINGAASVAAHARVLGVTVTEYEQQPCYQYNALYGDATEVCGVIGVEPSPSPTPSQTPN